MANSRFIADRTMPGLSARDLARRAADAIAFAYGGFAAGPAETHGHFAYRQAFTDLDRRMLRDLGVDRGSC